MNIHVFHAGPGQASPAVFPGTGKRGALIGKPFRTGQPDQITFSGKNNAVYNATQRGLKNIGWEGPIGIVLGQLGLTLFHIGSWITVPIGILSVMLFQFAAGILKKPKL